MNLPKAIKKIFHLCGCSYHSLYYFEKNLRLFNDQDSVKAEIDLLIREATIEDINNILKQVGESDSKMINNYLKNESTCFVALYENKIIGYSWISFKKVLFCGLPLRSLSKTGVFGFGGFVFPEYRNKKVFEALISYYCREMKRQGFIFVGNFVVRNNLPALKARQRFDSLKKKAVIITIFNLPILIGNSIGKGKLIENNKF
jgi:hypothetical protein